MSQDKGPDLPPIWNVPYRRNPFFTGRENILKNLHNILTASKTAALTQPQAISGLGGIGKTQTAVEYAYRYGSEYQAILWAKADSREVLTSDFVTIADLLNLPEKNEQDQSRVVNAVKRWLQTHTDWLLILDNVEDWEVVDEFVPVAARGHALLTTQVQATGAANRVDIHEMEPEEGALFLLRRAKVINSSDADSAKAKEISREMDGLPLALDQAGAFTEETGCSLSEYLDLYKAQRAELLKERGQLTFSHPEPVVTTFSLAFEKVKQANPATAELLRFCAFLYPDDIPEEIITEGAADLGPILQSIAANPLQLKKAIAELRKYSLVRRDLEAKTLSIHRLVQAVLKDEMDEETQCMWAERTVRAVNRALPDVEYAAWHRYQRCLPHVSVCATSIEQWGIKSIEAARLLDQAGNYLKGVAQLNAQAETLLQQSLAIREQLWGPNHPYVAISLNNLAELYRQGKYAQAEPLYQRALAIWEKTFGPEHTYVAICLSNLALLHYTQGKYAQAEPLFHKALAIWEKITGPEDHHIANTLNSLAELYRSQGKYVQAEPLYERALAIRKQTLGPQHRDVSNSLNGLALLYRAQGKYAQAEPLFQQALAIRKQILGPQHPAVAVSFNNLALLYASQGKYIQAESLYQQALAIYEQVSEPENPDIAICLHNLAGLYHTQGRYTEAEPLYQRALAIREKTLGPEHPYVATSLENYADLLRKMNREAEATELEARAKTIRAKHAQENQSSE